MRGLLVDFGGVLTSSVFGSFEAFCREEGLDPAHIAQLFRGDPRARDLLVELETGRLDEAEFERQFAAVLELEPEGLIARLFAAMRPDEEMIGAVRAAKAAGLTTGLLSNSWGRATRYGDVDGLFDASVISAEVGMRKPEPRIYEIAAERMGLPPEEIVFVDDLPFNLKPARALGMLTIVHRTAAETIPQLEDALGVPLSPG